MKLSTYLTCYPTPDEPDKVLLYHTARQSMARLDRSLLDDAQFGRLTPEEEQALAGLGFLVPDHSTEQAQILGLFAPERVQQRPFTALVTLNLDCNLDCIYCYEKSFRGKRYMNTETADQLCDYLINHHIAQRREVIIDFYGGEALLSLLLLKRIAERVGEAARQQGTSFSFNLITNGVLLTRAIVEPLKQLGLRSVRITLDGPPEIHNRQRPFVSGNGSFDQIVSNIEQICDSVTVQIGGNYFQDNYQRFPQLLDMLLERGITPERLGYILFTPITPPAVEAGIGDLSMGCACSSEPWLVEAGLYLREEILKRGFATPRPKLSACMVEFESELVIGWDGSLYKCPAFMGCDNLIIGSLTDGIGDFCDSHNMDVWKQPECLECKYLPLCFGGCRFMRRLRTGAIDGVDCRKDYLDAALERIIRQDLQYPQRQPKG